MKRIDIMHGFLRMWRWQFDRNGWMIVTPLFGFKVCFLSPCVHRNAYESGWGCAWGINWGWRNEGDLWFMHAYERMNIVLNRNLQIDRTS